MLIVIDGIDGSGKQTQTELLKHKLISKGKKVITYEFPNYSTFFGKIIRDYLDGKFGDSTKVDAKLISILYALDRFEVGKEMGYNFNQHALEKIEKFNVQYQS